MVTVSNDTPINNDKILMFSRQKSDLNEILMSCNHKNLRIYLRGGIAVYKRHIVSNAFALFHKYNIYSPVNINSLKNVLCSVTPKLSKLCISEM